MNLKEFRGFVFSDKRAPLIFINQTDSSAGKLFTLIHEFVHLFFDDSDLLTNHDFASHTNLEAKINRITAEILLPQRFLAELLDDQQNLEDNLTSISKRFEVSKFVVLRRLYDLKYISRESYISMKHQLEQEFMKLQKMIVTLLVVIITTILNLGWIIILSIMWIMPSSKSGFPTQMLFSLLVLGIRNIIS